MITDTPKDVLETNPLLKKRNPLASVMIKAEVPMPPSVNQMYANAPGKGRVKTDKYKAWRDTAGWELKLAKAEPLPPECKRWGLSIRVPLSGGDIDNCVKAISDLLVWMKLTPDDRYMRSLHVYRDHEIAKGRVQVTVWPV